MCARDPGTCPRPRQCARWWFATGTTASAVCAGLEMQLTIPPELGPAADVLAELRDRVQAVEVERAAERQRTGGRVCGRRAVLAQSWRSQPTTHEPRRKLRPRVAAQRKWARIEALLRNRTFVAAYATARAAWRDGIPALFPPGTYWLGRFAQVAVAEV